MDQHLIFLLLGLSNGAVYASLGLTLVVTYRSTGVVNFATGAMSMLGAYMYAFLRHGQLLIPFPFLPKTIDIGGDPGLWLSGAIATLISAVVGLLLYVGVFRFLRSSPAVTKAVASVGVMAVFTGLFQARVGNDAIPVQPILPTNSWTLGGIRISSDRIWFALIVVAIAVVLAAIYRFTRFGLVTRAAAESEKGAFVSGIAPDRIAAINWMISGAIGAVAGILISPLVPLTPIGYTLFIVPALAAATLGQFTAMVPAVLGGLLIGMIQSEMVYLAGQHTWLPTTGLAELVPLVLILIVLVARGKPLPGRGAVIAQTLGRAPRPNGTLRPAIVGSILAVVVMLVLQGDWRIAFIISMIMAIISLSLVVITGFAGQVSLAQLTLAGVAAFLLGPITTSWHVPFPFAPLLAALGAAVVGVVVGLPALRIRGLPVAVVTLAFAVAIEAVWFHNPDFVSSSGVNIGAPKLFGLDLSSRVGTDYPRLQFGLLVLVVLVAVAVGVAKLRTSRLGSAMLAVRANERSAAGAGIDVVKVKLIAFGLAAFIAGLGGAMLAYFQSNVTFDPFTTLVGLALFNVAYVAGITSVSGGLVAGLTAAGGVVALGADKWLSLGSWYGVIAGVALVVTVVRAPEGLVGPLHARLARRRAASTQAVVVPPTVAPPLIAMAPVEGGDVVLEVRGLSVRYGGVVAVDNVDLELRRGTIVGLIGPNGAGKTTLVDAITGFAASTGEVLVDGKNLRRLAPFKRVRSQLGRTFQLSQLYEDLSVRENVVVGIAAAVGREPRDLDETLELLDLSGVADRPVGELSQGRRQLVAVARALVGNPDVLLLDEPAGGLDSSESQWLGERLRRIRDSGVSILLIDHDMHLVFALCDSLYVLNFGEVIAHGSPDEIKADRGVTAAYLGETHVQAVTS